MSDRLREALADPMGTADDYYNEHMPVAKDYFYTIIAAARRFLALTETGRRLVDAVDAMYDDNDLFTAEEEEWDELLDAALELRAALADYLTEEE